MEIGEVKLLLFDDQRLKLKHYLSVLRFCGFREIFVAGEVGEAREIILSNPLDLIIVTHFDEGVGLDALLLELREIDGSSSVPVVALAPDLGVRYALGILSKGASGILMEPVSRETVEGLVAKTVGPRASQDPLKGMLKKAWDLLEAGHSEQALAAFNSYFIAYRTLNTIQDSRYFEGSLGLARAYAQSNQWLDAEEQLHTAITIARSFPDKLETHRELPKAYWEYGYLNEKRGLLERAIKSYRTALSVNPFFLPAIISLLILLHQRERLDEMIQLLEETGEGFLPYSEPLAEIAGVLHELANQSIGMGRLGMAMALNERLFMLPHTHVPSLLETADFFLSQGRTSSVLTRLMALSKSVREPALYFKIGRILLDSERWMRNHGRSKRSDRVDHSYFAEMELEEIVTMARDAFEESLSLEPGDPLTRLHLAYCRLRLGDRESISERLEELREGQKADSDFLRQGIELLMEGRYVEEAERWIKTALRQHPREIVFWQMYANLFKGRRMPKEASECLKRGLAIQPDHPGMTLALAKYYQESRQVDAAISLLEKATALLPEDAHIGKALQELLASRQQQVRKTRWFGLAR